MSTSPLYAIVSDIHGNLPALEAVIADAKAHGAAEFFNLGDILAGPLWPAETAKLLMSLGWQTISGNHERQMLTQSREQMGPSDRYASERIDETTRAWLASLPTVMRPAEKMLCVHGTPLSDLEYLLETVTPDLGVNLGDGVSPGVRQATNDEARLRLGGELPAHLVLCGHSHMPRQMWVETYLCANPGSVGLPAFDWDRPHPHLMETGTPQARYALVDRFIFGWRVNLRAVDYDHEAAARQAEANGRGDWADALRTGRVGRRET